MLMSTNYPSLCLIGGGEADPFLHTMLELQDQPNVLVVPSACTKQESYDRKVPPTLAMFEDKGVPTTVLHNFGKDPSTTQMEEKIGRANLIYTIGGYTPELRSFLTRTGFDAYLIQASEGGKTLCGKSAGALLAFEMGQSDPTSTLYNNADPNSYAYIPMLGLIKSLGIVHADQINKPRNVPRIDAAIDDDLAGEDTAIAMSNDAALITSNNQVRPVRLTARSYVRVISAQANGKKIIQDIDDVDTSRFI